MNKPFATKEIEREIDVDVVESGTLALLNKSEIDQQIATAHKYPRSLTKFLRTATDMVTLSESTAQDCIYALPRDGKVIEGPSVRFAEIIFSAWGNCRAGARVVNDDGTYVYAQGAFHDLERNAAYAFEVPRRVVDKQGRRYNADMVGMTISAASSIALRNAILKGIPKAIWSDLYLAARKTVMGDFETLPNRRGKAFEAFQAYGLNQQQVCKILGVRGAEDIGLDNLVTLGGILNALKENETTPEQLMKTAEGATDAPAAPGNGAPAKDAPGAPPVRGKAEAETVQVDSDGVIQAEKPKAEEPKPAEQKPAQPAAAQQPKQQEAPKVSEAKGEGKASEGKGGDAKTKKKAAAGGEQQPLIDDSALDQMSPEEAAAKLKKLSAGLQAAFETARKEGDEKHLKAWQNATADERKRLPEPQASELKTQLTDAWEHVFDA